MEGPRDPDRGLGKGPTVSFSPALPGPLRAWLVQNLAGPEPGIRASRLFTLCGPLSLSSGPRLGPLLSPPCLALHPSSDRLSHSWGGGPGPDGWKGRLPAQPSGQRLEPPPRPRRSPRGASDLGPAVPALASQSVPGICCPPYPPRASVGTAGRVAAAGTAVEREGGGCSGLLRRAAEPGFCVRPPP